MSAHSSIQGRLAIFAAVIFSMAGGQTARGEILTFVVESESPLIRGPSGLSQLPVVAGDRYSLFYTSATETPGVIPGPDRYSTLLWLPGSVLLGSAGLRSRFLAKGTPLTEHSEIAVEMRCASPFARKRGAGPIAAFAARQQPV